MCYWSIKPCLNTALTVNTVQHQRKLSTVSAACNVSVKSEVCGRILFFVRVLMERKSLWKGATLPILVICVTTNHYFIANARLVHFQLNAWCGDFGMGENVRVGLSNLLIACQVKLSVLPTFVKTLHVVLLLSALCVCRLFAHCTR